jgi:outer membrane receptor protein involved in Fe transport
LRVISSVGIALTMVLAGHEATAEPAEAAAAESAAPSSDSDQSRTQAEANTGLQEIIVTANKREESINKVGLTIQAFRGDDLQKQAINDVADLTKVVPGLTATVSGLGNPVYTLRGVGFYENSLAAYPDVSVYVDEVPLSLPLLSSHAGLDPERVEVLKGPQGILFGQNSTGGAINYVAAKPTDQFASGGDLSYGRFSTLDTQGYVSGPLTDTLKARFALRAVNADDWQYSYTRPGDTSGKKNLYVGRALFAWQPGDRFHATLNINGYLDRSDPEAAQYVGFFPAAPAFSGPYLTIPFSPSNARAANWSPDIPNRGRQQQYQVALRGDYDLSDSVKLTSITSYADYHRHLQLDSDGVVPHNQDNPSVRGSIASFSQELRAAGTLPTTRWTLGANFGKDKVKEDSHNSYGDATSSQIFHFATSEFYSDQDMTNWAGFANIEQDVADFTLKAGTRYTEAKRAFTACLTGDPALQATFTGIATIFGNSIAPLGPGDCVVIHYPSGLPGLVSENLNENNVAWRVGTDYHLSPTALLYANVAKGYKAGSFAALPGATSNQYLPVRQESVLDYEGGFKLQPLGGALSLNGAGFYYNYTNKQLLAKTIDPVFGPLDALVNIPKSRIIGAELSLLAAPLRGLSVSASATYLDAVVTKYVGVSGIGALGNYAGTPVPFTPKWQAAATADYDWQMNGLDCFIGETSTYNSSTYAVVGADPVSYIKSYYVLDLRGGVRLAGGRWTIMTYGRNVTNTFYWTNVTHGGADTVVRYAALPVTYGMTVSFRY